MKFLGFEIGGKNKVPETPEAPQMEIVKKGIPWAGVYTPNGGILPSRGSVYAIYDGEKNIGEMGPAKNYFKDYYLLRVRSKQLYIESEICQAVINRFTGWVIGDGLKLKAEPQTRVLEASKIKINSEEYNKNLEALWKVYANSSLIDYSGRQNLPALSEEAHREAKLGGDILVVLRVIDGFVKVQHIDGVHVGNPQNATVVMNENASTGLQSPLGYDYANPDNGNRIRMGVEIDAKGCHVAYWVRVGIGYTYERIVARDSKGFLRAYKYYGFKPEIDSTAGTPLLSIVMETAKKLERYSSAVLAKAEATAKMAITFEHGIHSDGENPMEGVRAKALIAQPSFDNSLNTDIPVDAVGNALANDFAVTHNSTVINLPPDVKATVLDSKQEVRVAEFAMHNIDIICAAVNIPPNVAMSKYEDSFSASRMAGKDWEHTFMTERADFSQHYLNPIKDLQTYIWVLENRVQAPGLIMAIAQSNNLVIQSYFYSRWVGASFPDIDPLKTVKYLREALGVSFEQVPLMTPEAAAEALGQGDIMAIIKQAGEELQATTDAGIELPDTDIVPPDRADDEKEGQTKKNQRKPKD